MISFLTYWIVTMDDIAKVERKVDGLWNSEFSGAPEVLKTVLECIVKSRRNIEPDATGKLFKETVENNLDTVLTMNSRWLVSVCDTYADCGDELESSNATMVSLMFNQIKLCGTVLDLVMDSRINGNKLNNYNTKPLWDGMWGFNVLKGDMVENLIQRMDKNLSATPTIHKIWLRLMDNVADSNNIVAVLKKIHSRGLYQL